MEVHYGANGKFTSPRTFTGGVDCGNSVFGDPNVGVRKWCETRAVTTAPVNQSLPTISGSTVQGQTLVASNGSWSGSPTSYGYQWSRCDSAGANCAAVSGATASSYQLASADVGKTLRVQVTASNTGGSTIATSAQSGLVSAATITVDDNTIGTSTNQFQYSGTWYVQTTCTYCYLGQNHLSSTLNDYALFRINGTQIKAYGTKGPSMGIVAYSVDGGPETLVDLYASARQDQQLLFTSPVLASGAHTLKIRVTRTKNALANSYWVIVDKAIASG